ncbi:MAG: RNA polymerase sigma factor, partial [Planctomycetota bacterium]
DSILVVTDRWMGARLKNYCSAEDVWQESLFHAWRDREKHEWRDIRSYRNWILTIIKNRIRDFSDQLGSDKRGGTRETLNFSFLIKSGEQTISQILPGRSTTPSAVAAYGEKAKKMEAALAKIPEDCEPVVRLHLFEELAMDEVGRQLGIPESTAWYRFRKGAHAYAKELAFLTGENPPAGNK